MLAFAVVVVIVGTVWGIAARIVRRRGSDDERLAERFNAFAPKTENDPWARW